MEDAVHADAEVGEAEADGVGGRGEACVGAEFDEADETCVLGCFLAFLILMAAGCVWALVLYLGRHG